MYERVARNGGDQALLLDFLERAAPDSYRLRRPQQIREAVDLAIELAQDDTRAEALLVRAVAAARETGDGVGSAPWGRCSRLQSAGSPLTISSRPRAI